jgi:hypothetical protein
MKPCRISMINNNMRQVFRTQGFEYQKQPAFLTAAINRKEGSDSHLPRFFSVSSECGYGQVGVGKSFACGNRE